MTAPAPVLPFAPHSGARSITTDAQLVAACLAGEEAAERRLYVEHVDALYAVAYRLCGDPDVAADITQEAFVRVFRSLHQFRAEAALRTWMVALLVSSAHRVRRKGQWLRRRQTSLHDGMRVSSGGEMRDFVAAAALDAAVARLPEKTRVVFLMHDVEGYKHHEIAAALGIPVGTSKRRLSDARARLRDTLPAAIVEDLR